ncbi:hypothetical protein WOLCODRAFT_152318 [Wolfiporia cocos MD-104 SS10]|uniref:Uncharacterized protein n=1 Tax=Wolfiporia cocos (strain MD-104) TaxID=742152 RepID=A0A2H3JWR0_WOLCO|nr:hypothetical protein WOLCODRAFT_152318 [Wolfiporia cocos MD-104 SS10]
MARSDPDFEPMPIDSSPIGSGKHEVSHGNTMFEDKEEDNANGIIQYSGDAALSGLLAGYAPTRYSFYDQLSRQNLSATGSSDFAEIPQEPFSGMRETLPEQTFMEYFTPITGSRCLSPVVVCPASMSLRSSSWDLSSPSRLTLPPLLQPPERIFEMQDQGNERLDDGQPEVANPVRNTEEATLAPRSLCQEQEDLSLPSPTVSAISTRSALQDSGYVTTTTGQHMAESVNACLGSPFSIKPTQEALRFDASSLPPAISLNATCSASISERLLDALDGQLFENADPWRALDKLLGLRVPSETTPETPNRGCRATSPTSAPENTDCGFLASLYDQSKRGVGYNMMNGLNADDRMPGSAPELTRSYISMNVVRHASAEQYGSRAVDELSTQSILAADLSQSISSETLAAPLSPEQSTSEDLSQQYEDQLPVEMHADCGSRLREDDMIRSPLQASLSHSTQQNQNPSDDPICSLVQDTRNPGISIASSSGTDNVSVEAERDKADEDDKRKHDESLPAMRNNISVTEQEFDGPCLFSNECESEDDG